MSDYNEHLITLAGGDDKTPTRLEQIQAREQEATSGPWHAGRGATADGAEFIETYGQKAEFLALSLNSGRSQLWLVDNGSVIPAVSGDGPKAEANAAFIANARDDIPYLLAKLAAIRALADAHGRQGFLVTPNDIRATLDAEGQA